MEYLGSLHIILVEGVDGPQFFLEDMGSLHIIWGKDVCNLKKLLWWRTQAAYTFKMYHYFLVMPLVSNKYFLGDQGQMIRIPPTYLHYHTFLDRH